MNDMYSNLKTGRRKRKSCPIEGEVSGEGHNNYTSKYFKSSKTRKQNIKGKSSNSEKVLSSVDQPMQKIGDTTKKLTRDNFMKDSITLGKYLLGKIIHRQLGNIELSGRIVETEAYLGVDDRACHTYGNKKTERVKPMYEVEGTSYVYSIYGMYHCLNISSSDNGGCVLIRALEPVKGIDAMIENRSKTRKSNNANKPLKHTDICSGPSKLCLALHITKENLNCVDMVTSDLFYVTDDGMCVDANEIVSCKRIGIEGYGAESANKPYRFYIKANRNVSSFDKAAENLLQN